jgi:hypothetical protein
LEKLRKYVFSSKISPLLLYQKLELKKNEKENKHCLKLFKISPQEREHLQIFSQSSDANDNSSSTRPNIHQALTNWKFLISGNPPPKRRDEKKNQTLEFI